MESKDWYDVDNVSKVFLASYNKRDTRCIRVSCELKEPVKPDLLQQALDRTVYEMPQFQVRIRRGIFWNYLEHTDSRVLVKEENGKLCPLLYGYTYKGILHYKVSYYRNRITFEVFHVLTDGTGAFEFLKVLVGNYLLLAHPEELSGYQPVTRSSQEEKEQDSYEQNYEKKLSKGKETENSSGPAYQISGRKLPYDQLQFFELHMDSGPVIANARALGCTVTSYLSGILMLAIKKDMPAARRNLPIAVSLPVNLRKFYGSRTSRNFFNNVKVLHTFTEEISLKDLTHELDGQLKASLDEELVKKKMNEYARLEHLLFTRMVPLAIKQPTVRYFARKEEKTNSATISNLGVIRTDPQITPYIDGFSIYCSYDGLFAAICSYGSDMCMGISYSFAHTGVLKTFVDLLHEEGISVKLDATEVVRS